MTRKTLSILILLAATGAALGAARVTVYLPREICVEDTTLTVGKLCVINADEDALRQRVADVSMGRRPWADEAMVVTRQTLLSRLVASGIDPDQVKFLGAESVTVRQNSRTFPAEQIIEVAQRLLKVKAPLHSGDQRTLTAEPKPITLADGEGATLEAKIASHSDTGIAVDVRAVRKGKVLETRRLTYRLAYRVRQAVALRDIPAGQTIAPEDVTLKTATSQTPEPKGWALPVGQVARVPIAKDTVINPASLEKPKPAIAVQRNQKVLMVIEEPGMQVTCHGIALQQARPGEFIKVRNTKSLRVVTAKVNDDGSVTPLH